MKRNIKISIMAGLLFFIAAAIAFAASTTTEEISKPEKVSQESISKSSEILKILDSNPENLKTKVVFDELQNKTIYEIENGKYFIDMDTNNNLVGIHSKNLSTNLESSNCNLDQAKKFILKKYIELGLPENYELNYIEKYDDLIWQANFEKNYNGMYNKFESVKVYFIPDNEEIIALGVFDEKVKSSEVAIAENEAKQTVMNYLNITEDEIISTKLSIEKANNFYNKESKDTSIHSTWVIQTKDNSIIYVDAQTNNVIGGDSINE